MKLLNTLMISLFLTLTLDGPVLYSYQLLDVGVQYVERTTEVILIADAPISYQSFSLSNPERIVIDCLGGNHLMPGATFTVGRGGVLSIQTSQLEKEGGIARVVIELGQKFPYLVNSKGRELILVLNTNQITSFPVWKASENYALASVVEERVTPRGRIEYPEFRPPSGGRLVSMDLEDADLLTVLRALADYSGKNIVAGSEVKGNVTVRLHNVPWRKALEEILKVSGFSSIEEDEIIRVAPPAKLKAEEQEKLAGEKAIELLQPMGTKVYKLEFATAGELKGPLAKMLSEKGTMEVESRTNSLVVTDIPSKQKQVAELVSILDSPTPQVEITARIVEVNLDAARHLGINWGAKDIQVLGIGGGDLTVTSPPGEAGIGEFKVGTITSWGDIDATISMMEREAKGKAIANPRIMATNNKEAEIFAGKKIPISTRDEAGNLVAQYIEAGVSMKITPHINSLEDITLDLYGEVAEPDLANLVLGLPLITTSKAQTRVLLRDGATVVLGGLKKSNVTRSERGVPILRSIPLLGYFFKSYGTTKEDRDILIFVTPHLVRRI